MKKQNGFSVFHVLLLLALVVAGTAYWKHQSKQSALRTQAEKALQEKEALRQKELAREKEEFSKKLAAEKAKSEFDKAVTALRGIHERWQGARRIAGSTGRIALATPMLELQSIRRETNAIVVPACAEMAKTKLVAAMDASIEGFMVFMQDKSLGEYKAAVFFASADDLFKEFNAGLDGCS